MTMSVVYSNFAGRVVSETRNGVESDYISDPLGSTIGLMNSAGVMTDRWEYWPYGEVVRRTGTNPTSLTFLGVIGYFQDVLSKTYYVRARHFRADLARWLTVDPTWPREPAYVYGGNSPQVLVDPTGLWCNPLNSVECILACTGRSNFSQGYICTFPNIIGDCKDLGGGLLICYCVCVGRVVNHYPN